MSFRIDYFREVVKVASVAKYPTLGAAKADVKFGSSAIGRTKHKFATSTWVARWLPALNATLTAKELGTVMVLFAQLFATKSPESTSS